MMRSVTTRDDEPVVLRSWPYAKPDPEHGLVYYQFGSYLATGELVYLPDPVETARRLAQPWRYEQRALWEEERAA